MKGPGCSLPKDKEEEVQAWGAGGRILAPSSRLPTSLVRKDLITSDHLDVHCLQINLHVQRNPEILTGFVLSVAEANKIFKIMESHK